MSYFKQFPYISYQFPDDQERLFKNLSIRPAVVDELLGDASNLQVYNVESGETPETIAFDVYGDEGLNWIIMLSNNIMNLYTDWPMSDEMLRDYMYEKYRTQFDSDGITRTLTDDQVYEFISFVGTPTNGYKSEIDLESGSNSPKVIIRPHHFVDENDNQYTYETISNRVDAFGRAIDLPNLTPISHEDYETTLNDLKRKIFIPSPLIANRMKRQLGKIVND